MKGIIAAKMSSMRKRSALSSSAASSSELTTTREVVAAGVVPKEPSSHHGKMRLRVDVIDPCATADISDELVDIILCVAVDSLHAVTDIDNSIVFEANFASMKEIVWDHSECSVRFVLEGDVQSSTFVFESTLVEVEAQVTNAIRSSGHQRHPDQVYVGVLVGRNLPSSPIHQRRASLTSVGAQQLPTLPTALRRELLAHERPPRSISPRENLALQYFRSGVLSFPCSINGDARGLKLDGNFLYVYPSPDGYDRSACLFSYQYEQVDTCEVRGGVRLELRFRRSGAKQPTFIAFQSPDAQYIRDAIWYFQHGVSMDEYFRHAPNSEMLSACERTGSSGLTRPPRPPGRRNSLKSFQNDDAINDQIQSCCIVVGCTRRCVDLANTTVQDYKEVGTNGIVRRRKIWYCQEHAPIVTDPGSPPRSPSKRSGLLSRGKSAVLKPTITQSKHYVQSVKYHGTLLKSGGKYQLTRSWNQKIVALIDTPLGGFLCYYDKLAHCPGQSESAPKERRIIDLSGVICVRREGVVVTGSQQQPYAFDIVTVYRTWTFAASDIQEYEVWLTVLGQAIERRSSMSPDKPLRFPVKCLRDPLHNLPSRNDGTTALEVSSNGVTVCSGTDGDSEVYNWYFTDIQKWSVAKQHDNSTCCFISCAVDLLDPTTHNSATSSRYQDFLFHTPEAEAICSAIEFFVGRCMAKLEVLGLMYMHAQQRQSSRRLSLESVAQKPAAATTVDDKPGKVIPAKVHTVTAVSLRAVGPVSITTDSECIRQTAPEGLYLPPQSAGNTQKTSDDSQLQVAMHVVPMPREPSTISTEESGAWCVSQPPAPIEVESRSVEFSSRLVRTDVVPANEQLECELEVGKVASSLSNSSTRLSSTESTTEGASLILASSHAQPQIQDEVQKSENDRHPHCELLQNYGDCLDSISASKHLRLPQIGGDAVRDSSSIFVDAPVENNEDCDSSYASPFEQICHAPMEGTGIADRDRKSVSAFNSITDTSVQGDSDGQFDSFSSSQHKGDGLVEDNADGDPNSLSPSQDVAESPVADGSISALSASEDIYDILSDDDADGLPDSLSSYRDSSQVDATSDGAVGDSCSPLASHHISYAVVKSGDEVAEMNMHQSSPQLDLSSHPVLLNDQPQWPDGLSNFILEEQIDADNDRFVSFQYCECTVGEVEDTISTCGRVLDEADDDARECDEAFEDARCDFTDTTENSVVVIDCCDGNDEDSLVVLEDEESNSRGIDTIDDVSPVHDPIDELSTELEGDCQLDEEVILSSAMISSEAQGSPVGMKSTILPSLTREWACDDDTIQPKLSS